MPHVNKKTTSVKWKFISNKKTRSILNYELIEKTIYKKILSKKLKTYPADCWKIAAVDSNKHDWDWKNRRYRKKKIFVQKHFLSPIYFDGIS